MKRTLLLLLLFCFWGNTLHAQMPFSEIQKEYQSLNDKRDKGEINTEAFLEATRDLTHKIQSNGPVDNINNLIKLLNPYRVAAWSSTKWKKFRVDYYYFLMNNADMSGRIGEAIFYAEKYERESEKWGRSPGPAADYMKIVFYVQNKNYSKAIEIYSNEKSYFKNLSKKENVKNNSINEMLHSIQILAPVAHAFVKKNDLAEANKIFELSKQIYSNFKSEYNIDMQIDDLANSFIYFIGTEISIAQKDFKTAKNYLELTERFLLDTVNQNQVFAVSQRVNLLEWWMKYYEATSDYEKSEYYLKQISRYPSLYSDYAAFFNLQAAKISEIRKDYSAANIYLNKVITEQDKELANISNEFAEVMYAHTEAEFNRIQLDEEITKRSHQRKLIFIIIALSALTISGFLLFLRYMKKRAEKKLEGLRKMTDVIVDATRIASAHEEQRRLSQELHDEYSATLASLLHNMELNERHEHEAPNKEKWAEIRSVTSGIYESVRGKSHKLFQQFEDNAHHQFEENVKQIINIALPSVEYKTEIEIESRAATELSYRQRVELLKIIREAATNIVKHSKATEASIFLYQSQRGKVLQISDNGIGINKKGNVKGIGLKSMEQRVKKIDGTLEIIDEDGTTILINLPNEV